MLQISVLAPDEEGLRIGFEQVMKQRAALKDCRSPHKRDGRFMTVGNVLEVRDLIVYGTVDRPKAHVGVPYKTPEWMLNEQ